MIPVALTVAGSDPSGGAGLQADLKTFHQFGVYGEAVVTLVTVQNTRGIAQVHLLEEELVVAQLQAVLGDIRPHAMKTGALGSDALVRALARHAPEWNIPLVLDPVLFSKDGSRLSSANPLPLFPHAALLTPNLAEAEALTGLRVSTVAEMRQAAMALAERGARSVLVKGGHLAGDRAIDVLLHQDAFTEFSAGRTETRHTHGTGCTYSAAITALLACGLPLPAAVERAKTYITEAIRTNPGLGAGHGPVNHWA